MKALSLTQPWAWLVVYGGKDIENRVWHRPNAPMQFYVHASKGMKPRDYEFALAFTKSRAPEITLPPREELQFGGILGLAERSGEILQPHPSGRRWHMEEQFGYVLSKVEPTPFVECAGSLGFWEVPEDVLARLPSAPKSQTQGGLWLQDNW